MKKLILLSAIVLAAAGCGTSHHAQVAAQPKGHVTTVTPSPSRAAKVHKPKSNANSTMLGHAPAPRPTAGSRDRDPYWGTRAPGYEPPVPGQDCEPGQKPGPNGC